MAGQVDGDERATERQRDRVPRVGVLGAAVDEHHRRRPVAPHERAHLPAALDGHRLPPHDRRALVGDAELGGVVGEHAELVVGHPFGRLLGHYRPSWRATPPSTRRHVPVIHAEASLAKNSAAPGKSSA